MLLVPCDGPAPDPENSEKIVVEALRLAFFVGRVPPLMGELGGTGANFVPGQAHGLQGFRFEIVLVDLSDRVAHLCALTFSFRGDARQIRLDLPLQIMNRHHSQPSGLRQ